MMGSRTCFMFVMMSFIASAAFFSHSVLGQGKGKGKGDLGEEVLKNLTIPPAPALAAEDEMKTFKIAPGYRVELVAKEPLVHDPIAMTFDPDGRIWVVEMRGYMPNIDGKGEKEPVCTVSVLEDINGDGVMDKSTVFVDKLVLPRALCWTTEGLLVAENGHIWMCRDTTGGLKCNDKKLVCEYLVGNTEHALNGLMPALDNWIYNAKEGVRLRKIGDQWVRQVTPGRGQWGMTQDNAGYLYYNVNASLIHGDLVPCYAGNAQVSNSMVNNLLYKDQTVYPIRVNAGINRGYDPTFLRPDGTMIKANANCGPVVYRGDNLPKELLGDIFISDPAGNLVRRQRIVEVNGLKTSKNAYDEKEFLASTDERFRPVNMFNAPDGTLYIVDMYRGIIQAGQFVTPFLRKYSLDHNLEQPIGMGRIYRIVHETTQPRPPISLGKASANELVDFLSHPNGWHRDMAQQLLVQRKDMTVVPALQKLAASGANPLGRLHAVWTLEGMGAIDADLLEALGADRDANVRASALAQLRGPLTRQADPTDIQQLAPLAKDADKIVRMQLVFALGMINTQLADRTLEPVLKEAAANPEMLDALLAGFAGRESEFLTAHLSAPDWSKEEVWRTKLLASAANLMWRQRQPLPVLRFLHLVGDRPNEQSWQQIAMLEGALAPPPKKAGGAKGGGSAKGGANKGAANLKPLTLPTVPEGLEKLRKSSDKRLASAAEAVAAKLVWPGKDGKPLPVLPPLSEKDQLVYDQGKKEFLGLCAACHHPQGFGEAGKGPALLDSDWLEYSDERLIRLVLYGLRGGITINDEPFNRENVLEMPPMQKVLDDQKVAAILTFVRREWGENPPVIRPETVRRIRAATIDRGEPWSQKELLTID